MKIFEDIINKSCNTYSNINITFLEEYIEKYKNDKVLIITSNIATAEMLFTNLKKTKIHLYLQEDLVYQGISLSKELKINNAKLLNNLANSKVIITNVTGFLDQLPSIKNIQKNGLLLQKNSTINLNELINYLNDNGYQRTSVVESGGFFAIRGLVFDIGFDNNYGIRIILDDDKVLEIKKFYYLNQLTFDKIPELELMPLALEGDSNLFELYKPDKCLLFNEMQIKEKLNLLIDSEYNLNNADLLLNTGKIVMNEYIGENDIGITKIKFNSNDLNSLIKNKQKIIFNISKEQLPKIDKIFENYQIINHSSTNLSKINVIYNGFCDDFIYNNVIYVNLEKNLALKQNRPKIASNNIKFSFTVGDYVVHERYGIGQFIELTQLVINGKSREYLKIAYYGSEKLYVPVEKIKYLSKFTAIGDIRPRLNKIMNNEWEKTKARVKTYVKEVSKEIIKYAALRKSKPGLVYTESKDLEDAFSLDCPFILTEDQEAAWSDIKKDMESSIIMDRLICGDVGFGKTEIAFRAAFKAIASGYQVMYLCPTTVLAKQQFIKAKARFANFAINIEMYDRTVNKTKSLKIIENLINKKIDFIIGTHRLLSKDVNFNNIGLVIVDEEQRFGVELKEKIKMLREEVDIISLSATPIPRTLQMSLVGLKDLSIINTPPLERLPVLTYVLPYNEFLIKDVVENEMQRGGQIFYLQNKIIKIEDTYSRLKKILPNARITYIHGQDYKPNIENRLTQFINLEYDVLIATTIIETGVDIPNANTIIVENAENLGLGQLYQLKGRVGRSNQQAYAYLLFGRNKILSDEASARLNSIKQLSSLGSGIEIAKRDLAIRGAGDILGRKQAGFINAIGIDLYNKMLEQELNKDEELKQEVYDKPLLNIATNVLNQYSDDPKIKLLMHELINKINDLSTYLLVKNEFSDRFGKVNKDLDDYFLSLWFEELAREKGIINLNETPTLYELIWPNKNIKLLKKDYFSILKLIEFLNSYENKGVMK